MFNEKFRAAELHFSANIQSQRDFLACPSSLVPSINRRYYFHSPLQGILIHR
jgi:hypothetical protein